MKSLILASSSVYRRQLLARLQLPFDWLSADVDESSRAGERPPELALRLAHSKAATIAASHTEAVVVGSDQVASCAGVVLTKPGTGQRAAEQLRHSSGRRVHFHTSVVVLGNGRSLEHVDHTVVLFRTLSDTDISNYLERESVLDCAGSFKCEGLGISLFSKINNEDPTALIGLPLIRLCQMLRECGYTVPPN